MAQNENILTRLGKLFQSNIIVRKTDSGGLKVKDVDYSHMALTSNFIDRYNCFYAFVKCYKIWNYEVKSYK